MKPTAKGALLLLLAFLLGIGAGAAGVAAYQARTSGWHSADRPGQFQQFILKRLTKELELRPEQQQRIEAMLKETGQEFAKLREEMAPRFRDLRLRGRDRIRTVLDAGQQAKYEQLEQEWARRGERRSGREAGRAGENR
jgi:Spy/CpxP family protein refolding chaperone